MAQDVRRNPWGGQYLLRSGVFLIVLVVLGVLFQATLIEGFWTNPWLNGTILALFVLGVIYTLKGMVDAYREGQAIHRAGLTAAAVRRGEQKIIQANELLFAPNRGGIGEFLATVHRVIQHGGSSGTLPYLLDSIAARGEDRRALARYLIGALVLLGLIGTFFGLLVTIGGVRDAIDSLAAGPGTDTVALLAGLRERLAVPLGGMGMAFSTSLFGLLASLALAFLELQLFHAQNHGQARLETLVVSELLPLWQTGPAPVTATATGPAPDRYTGGLLAVAVERLDRIGAQLEAGLRPDGSGQRTAEQLALLNERIESLRQTLEGAEWQRTAELRQELRALGQLLARREAEHHGP